MGRRRMKNYNPMAIAESPMTAPDSRDSVVEQLRALLTLAEKATPGPWQSKNAHEWDEVVGNIDGPDAGQFHYTHVCSVDMRDLRTVEQIANAEIISGAVNFIRTHGPEVLQALARGPQQAGGEDAKDAARYRWIRACDSAGEQLVMTADGRELKMGHDLDAAIDAALNGGQDNA